MKAAINRVIRLVFILYYWCVVCWRFQNGRFFVYRDIPQWFVEWVAAMPEEEFEEDGQECQTLVIAARNELRFRAQRKAAKDFGNVYD